MTEERKRRLPTRLQLGAWREYIETAEALRSRIASRLQAETGMSMGDYQVLLALSEAEGSCLRSSELAALISWERSRLSHHLGRMEKRGLIRREEVPGDSRGALVVMTESGAKTFREGSLPHLEAVRELFLDAFSESELADVQSVTGALRQHLGLARR